MSTTIEDRVILLLRDKAGELESAGKKGMVDRIKSAFASEPPREVFGGHGFWERLGDYTGINSKRWRKVYARDQRITSDMLEALAQLYPDYAFWLVTGITDATNGHIAPDTAQAFPERIYQESHGSHQYFRKSLDLARKLYKEAHVNLSDDKERMYAAERTRPLAHWWDSPLCDTAYRIASSEEYQYLKELWNAREEERERHLRYIREPDNRPWVIARKKAESEGAEITPFMGIDSRTNHQDRWDLFYQPVNVQQTKFARRVLNISPRELVDDDMNEIAAMSFSEVNEYLRYHSIDTEEVFELKGGFIRYGDKGLLPEEVERFKQLVMKYRKT